MNAIVSKVIAASAGTLMVVAAAVVPASGPTRVAIFHNGTNSGDVAQPTRVAIFHNGTNSGDVAQPTRVAIFHNGTNSGDVA